MNNLEEIVKDLILRRIGEAVYLWGTQESFKKELG